MYLNTNKQKIKNYCFYLSQQIEILHLNGLVLESLDINNIIPFSRGDGIIILDAFKSIKVDKKKEPQRFEEDFRIFQKLFGYNPFEINKDSAITGNKNESNELKETVTDLLRTKRVILPSKVRLQVKNRGNIEVYQNSK